MLNYERVPWNSDRRLWYWQKDEMIPNKLTLIKDTGWDSMTLQIHKLDVVVAVAVVVVAVAVAAAVGVVVVGVVVVEITPTPHPANWLPAWVLQEGSSPHMDQGGRSATPWHRLVNKVSHLIHLYWILAIPVQSGWYMRLSQNLEPFHPTV